MPDSTIKKRVAATLIPVVLALAAGTASFEGKENAAYVDRLPTVPVITICYGHTETAKLGQYKTDAECNSLLMEDLTKKYAPGVRKCITAPLTQGEFNAIVDFAYNVGISKACNSTMFKLINKQQYDLAGKEFMKWTFVGGKDCKIAANRCGGIVKRRQWQAAQFAS